jgi:hypothetical protein
MQQLPELSGAGVFVSQHSELVLNQGMAQNHE